MRLVPVIAGGAAVAPAPMLALVAPASAAPAPHTTYNYVALGDSYSSGVGTDDYDSSSGDCDRSPEGYPSLFEAAHTVSSFDFEACSGAKTTDVIANQLGGLSASTNLVSITIGGNDVGFTDTMIECITLGDTGCKNKIDSDETFVHDQLPALLDAVYSDIRTDAPNAQVVVLGYPEFYQLGGSCIVGLSDTSRGYINQGADELDSAIQTESAKYGFTFADVRSAFSSHEICSSDWWLHAVTVPVDDSYHPEPAGYSGGFLPALDSAVG
jgi:lysophospholipase L1-like esterase